MLCYSTTGVAPWLVVQSGSVARCAQHQRVLLQVPAVFRVALLGSLVNPELCVQKYGHYGVCCHGISACPLQVQAGMACCVS